MSLYIKLGIGSFMILILLITGFAHQKDEAVLPRLEWSGELTLHQLRCTHFMGENAFSQGADVRRIEKYVMNIVEMGRVGVEVMMLL